MNALWWQFGVRVILVVRRYNKVHVVRKQASLFIAENVAVLRVHFPKLFRGIFCMFYIQKGYRLWCRWEKCREILARAFGTLWSELIVWDIRHILLLLLCHQTLLVLEIEFLYLLSACVRNIKIVVCGRHDDHEKTCHKHIRAGTKICCENSLESLFSHRLNLTNDSVWHMPFDMSTTQFFSAVCYLYQTWPYFMPS